MHDFAFIISTTYDFDAPIAAVSMNTHEVLTRRARSANAELTKRSRDEILPKVFHEALMGDCLDGLKIFHFYIRHRASALGAWQRP